MVEYQLKCYFNWRKGMGKTLFACDLCGKDSFSPLDPLIISYS